MADYSITGAPEPAGFIPFPAAKAQKYDPWR
jgi:hypothetical protein